MRVRYYNPTTLVLIFAASTVVLGAAFLVTAGRTAANQTQFRPLVLSTAADHERPAQALGREELSMQRLLVPRHESPSKGEVVRADGTRAMRLARLTQGLSVEPAATAGELQLAQQLRVLRQSASR